MGEVAREENWTTWDKTRLHWGGFMSAHAKPMSRFGGRWPVVTGRSGMSRSVHGPRGELRRRSRAGQTTTLRTARHRTKCSKQRWMSGDFCLLICSVAHTTHSASPDPLPWRTGCRIPSWERQVPPPDTRSVLICFFVTRQLHLRS